MNRIALVSGVLLLLAQGVARAEPPATRPATQPADSRPATGKAIEGSGWLTGTVVDGLPIQLMVSTGKIEGWGDRIPNSATLVAHGGVAERLTAFGQQRTPVKVVGKFVDKQFEVSSVEPANPTNDP